jgi:hypothetical protein
MKSSSERLMSCVGDALGCSGLYRINSMHVIGKSVGYYVKPRFDGGGLRRGCRGASGIMWWQSE